ncbi:DMT family transporter [Terasakiella sp. A23]|uniref:DMT family transporter n=1 Tax=Terasakiella sp. FCG-A23 TaxID=3080561 RepID=UPI0029538A2C|nr:DMT family transporter [Terasakiella sp. A23]MDV7339926.1 DMT family transporter [Terasakiella sp. A23]
MSRLRANFLLLIVAFIWGTAFVAQQTGMDSVGPFTFTGLRFVLGALVVLPFGLRELARHKASGGTIATKDWIGMGLCGVFLYSGSVSQQIGLEYTSVTNAGFFTGLYVPLVPLIMLVFWRKLPHWSIWPAAFGCMVGTYYLSGGSFSALNKGDLWVIAGSVFWALQVIVIGFVVKSTQTPVFVAAIQFACCAVIGMTGALSMETMTMDGILGAGPELLYAGILSIGVAFTLQAVAQRHTPQADAAIIMSGEIVFAAIAGAIIQGDRLTTEGYIGCVVMFGCILAVELLPLLRKRKPLAS